MSITPIAGFANVTSINQDNSMRNSNHTDAFSTTMASLEKHSSANNAKPGIEVTLSDNAKRISSSGLPGWVTEQSEKLRANPDQASAMRYVESMATISGGALISNGPNSDGINDVYYAATGLPVTPESKARFESLSQSIVAETSKIFHTELAKGTSAADIFEKIHQHMATQPKDYLEATEWFRSTLARE